MSRTVQIAPSILSADFLNLERDVHLIEKADPQPGWLHVDVMDGHFVPNLTIGPPIVKALKAVTEIPLDVHLMIDNPATQLDWYLEAGASLVTIHVESHTAALANAFSTNTLVKSTRPVLRKGTSHVVGILPPAQVEELASLLARIRAAGVLAGLALNPNTPTTVLEPLVGLFDVAMVMAVHPGFAGQSFIASSADKVASLAAMRMAARGKLGAEAGSFLIEVDGGIDTTTTPSVVKAGADIIVAGKSVFGAPDPLEAYARLYQVILT